MNANRKHTSYHVLGSLFVLINIMITLTVTYASDPTPRPALQGISEVLSSSGVSDEVKLETIANTLDAGASLSARDAAQLVRLAAEIPYSVNAQERAERLDGRRKAMRTLALDIAPAAVETTKSANRGLLFLSAGLLGIDIDQQRVVSILSNSDIAPEIRLVAIDALLKQERIISDARPVLLKLARDPWSYVDYNDVGPQKPHKVYPLRDRAYEALLKLGVNCHKIMKEEAEVDPSWNMRFFQTVIDITE